MKLKQFAPCVIAIGYLSCISGVSAALKEEVSGQQIFKIRFFPHGDALVTNIKIDEEELNSMRKMHAGVPREEVTPCLSDRAIFSPKYFRLEELQEIKVDPNDAPSQEQVVKYGYGVRQSFPLLIAPKAGEPFTGRSFDFGSKGQPWGICKTTGELEKFSYWFDFLTMRVVNSELTLKLKTLEIMELKGISPSELDVMKGVEENEFNAIKEKDTIDALNWFIIKNEFSDIANLVKSAKIQRQRLVNIENAPRLAEQGLRQEEQARKQEELDRELKRATNVFLDSIKMGGKYSASYVGTPVCMSIPESSWQIHTSRVFFGQEAVVNAFGNVVVKGFIEDAKNGRVKLLITEIKTVVLKSSIPELIPVATIGQISNAQAIKTDGSSHTYQKGYVWDSPDGWQINNQCGL